MMANDKAARILIAEGDAAARNALMWCFLKEGFAVEPVATGIDAAAALQATPPDVAIIDLALPTLDCRRLITAMQSDPRLSEVPVLATSRNAPRSAVPDHVAFLRKPFEPELALQVVRLLLEPDGKRYLKSDVTRRPPAGAGARASR